MGVLTIGKRVTPRRRNYPSVSSHLDESGVEVDVVGHDHGPHDTDSLAHLDGAAILAVRHEHPHQQLALVWAHCHVLTVRKQERN